MPVLSVTPVDCGPVQASLPAHCTVLTVADTRLQLSSTAHRWSPNSGSPASGWFLGIPGSSLSTLHSTAIGAFSCVEAAFIFYLFL